MKNDIISKCILEYKRKFTDPRLTCTVGRFLGGVCLLWLAEVFCLYLFIDRNYQVSKIKAIKVNPNEEMKYTEDEAWYAPRD